MDRNESEDREDREEKTESEDREDRNESEDREEKTESEDREDRNESEDREEKTESSDREDPDIFNLINGLSKLNVKLTKKQQEVDKLFMPNSQGISKWVLKKEIAENKLLNWGNNGAQRHGVFFNDDRYIWEKYPEKGAIQKIRTNGYDDNHLNKSNRPIRKDIDKYHKEMGCVVCGSKSDLVTDHKNDLYNDERVLHTITQTFEDFQCLCNHCNLQKRQVMKITRKTGKRYSAKNIPQLKYLNVDYTKGNHELNINDKNTLIGTYWYDPIDFIQKALLIYKENENIKSVVKNIINKIFSKYL